MVIGTDLKLPSTTPVVGQEIYPASRNVAVSISRPAPFAHSDVRRRPHGLARPRTRIDILAVVDDDNDWRDLTP
ncbi:MAG TPA: hypothetical protein VGD91_12260, partial [Trebonia sp.]